MFYTVCCDFLFLYNSILGIRLEAYEVETTLLNTGSGEAAAAFFVKATRHG